MTGQSVVRARLSINRDQPINGVKGTGSVYSYKYLIISILATLYYPLEVLLSVLDDVNRSTETSWGGAGGLLEILCSLTS